ncbi:Spo11/DNA topoisomerase VI subunit A [Macrophomina phaseolina]|uniref:DNA topoisomerase (ATP-hydrolyzing) n=1 Tax=Macrophomina phaseolina TaxID=35725 RepID=A0ABQ8G296_9PEZI|nr:Spo11/DNA topoisomerase VI subunit A [Macrophomina phaseolina]
MSLRNSSRESLTDATTALWAISEDDDHLLLPDAHQHISPSQPSGTLRTASLDLESQWLEEDLFAFAEASPRQELRFSNTAPVARRVCHKERLISSIESVFESMLDVLLAKEESLTILVKSRPRALTPVNTSGRLMRFPGKTAEEAWRFTVLIRILEIVHEALITDRVISKREIYYRHPALFTTQVIVDRYIDDIAYTFGTYRSLLNVCAAAKGLVSGPVSIQKGDNTVFQKLDDHAGHLIPNNDGEGIIQTTAKWILVVEKEALFRSISASSSWEVLRHQGVMVTGKGYPDLSTRAFLRQLCAASVTGHPHIPIYALVDFDPDGLSIMCTYKYGSSALAHEGDAARLPSMQWLGVKSTQAFPPKCSGLTASSVHQNQGLLHLTHRDRKKAVSILCKACCCETDISHEIARELQIMLMLNLKAETELLESRYDGLAGWLMEQLPT